MANINQKQEGDKVIFESENVKVEMKKVDINEFSEVMLEIYAKIAIAKYDKIKLEKMLNEIKAVMN